MVEHQAMDLLERADSLATLEFLRNGTAKGGRIALVTGEAGLGKTALVTEFVARIGQTSPVLWGGCDPLATPRPLGPWRDIARQTGLVMQIDEGTSREALFARVLDALDRSGPVVVIEDVHWADEATLDLLTFVGRRVARTTALLVVTCRDDEMHTAHPVRAALAALPRDVLHRIPLVALSAGAVTTMAQRSGRDAAGVHAHTGGNPLLVTELLAAGRPGVPPTVRDLMQARFRGLSPAARAAAQLVSVVPGRADLSIVAGHSDAITGCIDAGVLVGVDDGVAFRHELLRQAVYDSLSPVRCAELHAAALLALTRVGADPAQLAHHAERAGDIAALLEHANAAARRAKEVNGYREAAAHLRSVLQHLDRLPPREQAQLLDDYGVQSFYAGDAHAGLPALHRALALWEQLGDRREIGANLRSTARLAWWLGRTDEATSAASAAVEVLETLPPGRELALAYGYRSLMHYHTDDFDQTVAWGEKAMALARRVGAVEAETHARGNVAGAWLRWTDVGPEEVEAIHEIADKAGLVVDAERNLVNLAAIAVEKSAISAAAARSEQALQYALDHDLYGYAQFSIGIRAGVRLEQGDWGAARSDALQSLDWNPQVGPMQIPALVALGRLQARTGEPAAAATLDAAADLAYPTGQMLWVCPVAIARSEFFWLAGDHSRALREARHGLDVATGRRHIWLAGALAWRAFLADDTTGIPDAIDPLHRALIAGDWQHAAQEWANRGALYARAEALIHGDGPAAAEAMHTFTTVGATRVAQRWRGELHARGTRGPRASTTSNPAGLTTRQLAVLELIAEGLSNAEIAERLSLAPKTVAHHVSAVLAKLGVSGRVQAAAAHRLNTRGGP